MPTYEYECAKCKNQFEVFQRITAKPVTKCPKCGGKVKRLIGTGAGIIFKGSGFYATDYRSESYKKAATADKSDSAGKSSSSSSDAKPAKPAAKDK
ncbi:MAG: FmdB family zinc ribbon protein [Lentisphaerota bacterium]